MNWVYVYSKSLTSKHGWETAYIRTPRASQAWGNFGKLELRGQIPLPCFTILSISWFESDNYQGICTTLHGIMSSTNPTVVVSASEDTAPETPQLALDPKDSATTSAGETAVAGLEVNRPEPRRTSSSSLINLLPRRRSRSPERTDLNTHTRHLSAIRSNRSFSRVPPANGTGDTISPPSTNPWHQLISLCLGMSNLYINLILPEAASASYYMIEYHANQIFGIVDGGGIRGYLTLLILQELEKRITLLERIATEEQRAENDAAGFRNPQNSHSVWLCWYFDIVAGTSTGG